MNGARRSRGGRRQVRSSAYPRRVPALHPNPPRLITVALAVGLAVIGFGLAWPVPAIVDLVRPLTELTAGFGLGPTPETGYLCLFGASGLLVAGSLLPGI